MRYGLVSRVYEDRDALIKGATAVAQKIASKSLMATAFTKRAIKQTYELGETAAIAHERSLFIAAMSTQDKREGIKAFNEKRKPDFKDR